MTAGDKKGSAPLKPGQAADYLSFLSSAAQEISSSLDYSATLKNVAHAMIPKLSDWCAVDIVQEDGSLKRLATAHIDPKMIKKALELGKKYPRNPHAKSGTPPCPAHRRTEYVQRHHR